jgi:hypothetical protein
LGILHKREKDVCDQCGEKFTKYEDLISHARHIHRHPMKKIDCTTSERSIKGRSRAENTKICMSIDKESFYSPSRC